MWLCPICRTQNSSPVCACGYDPSADAERYPTLMPFPVQAYRTLAARRDEQTDREFKTRLDEALAPVLLTLGELDKQVRALQKKNTALEKKLKEQPAAQQALDALQQRVDSLEKKLNTLSAAQQQKSPPESGVSRSVSNRSVIPVLMVAPNATSGEEDKAPIWGQTAIPRSAVTKVTFCSSQQGAPASAWDVSENRDRSVLAWMEGGELKIAANGRVVLNPNSEHLFEYFVNAREILFSGCVDASRISHCSWAFNHCHALERVDFSDWNLSMNGSICGMFNCCSALTALDLSSFKQAHITNLSWLLRSCSSLRTLNLTGLRLTDGMDTDSVFIGCGSVRTLICPDEKLRQLFFAQNPGSPLAQSASKTPQTNAGTQTVNFMRQAERAKDLKEKAFFWGQESVRRCDVRSVSFHSTLQGVPASAWDVSQKQDKSVRAWMDGTELKVAANGRISPNPNGSFLFEYFTNLTELHFNGCFDTAQVTSTAWFFDSCFSLTALDVSGFDTAKVTDFHGMFSDCASLTSLDLSGFKTGSADNMRFMFYRCAKLTDLNLSGFVTTGVTDVSKMFQGCSSLPTLNLGSFSLPDDVKCEDIFTDTSALSRLTYKDKKLLAAYQQVHPNSKPADSNKPQTGSAAPTVNFMRQAERAKDLKEKAFFWGQESVRRCDVKSVSFHSTLQGVPASAWDVSQKQDKSVRAWMNGTELKIAANGRISPNPVGSFLFEYFTNLTELHFNGCFDTAQVTSMAWFFDNCSSLTSLDVSCFDTAKVTTFNGMFSGCRKLTSLDLSGFKTGSANTMRMMFWNCMQLTDLNLSGFVTTGVTDVARMFRFCSSLPTLNVTSFSLPDDVNCEDIFSDTPALNRLTYKDKKLLAAYQQAHPNAKPVGSDKPQPVSVMRRMESSPIFNASKSPFWGQKKYARRDVQSVIFHNTLKSVPSGAWDVSENKDGSVMAWMNGSELHAAANGRITLNANASNLFSDFSELRSVRFNDCVDFSAVTDLHWIFYGCSQLTELDLSGIRTGAVTDLSYAFGYCGALTTLNLSGVQPAQNANLSNIFACCPKLKTLTAKNEQLKAAFRSK